MTVTFNKEQQKTVVVFIIVGVIMGAGVGYMIAPNTVEYTDPPEYNPADHEHTQHGHLGIYLSILSLIAVNIYHTWRYHK